MMVVKSDASQSVIDYCENIDCDLFWLNRLCVDFYDFTEP